MSIAKERIEAEGFVPRWVRLAHQARFEFASRYVAGKAVLDCACGEAFGSALFLKSGASRVYALDRSDATILHAASRIGANRIHFIASEATRIPLPQSTIDVYISLETIEHVDRDGDYLREATRLLKPDGVFICSTPNRSVVNPGKTLTSRPWNPFHVREYSRTEFMELLSRFWGEVEIYGQNPLSARTVRVLGALGSMLPGYGAVRMRQILKLPRLIVDRTSNYSVIRDDGGRLTTFESLLAVCRRPQI
jgi:SAM-dependent methyltransferase